MLSFSSLFLFCTVVPRGIWETQNQEGEEQTGSSKMSEPPSGADRDAAKCEWALQKCHTIHTESTQGIGHGKEPVIMSRAFTCLLCLVCVGDWHAGGREVTSAEGNRWAPKGEGQAGARPGGSPPHLQKRRLRLRVRRTAASVHFGRYQTGAGRHQFTQALNQAADEDWKAKAEDNHPQQVCVVVLRCCCRCWVRVASHPSSHIHSFAHTLHSWHGLHLSVCPTGH